MSVGWLPIVGTDGPTLGPAVVAPGPILARLVDCRLTKDALTAEGTFVGGQGNVVGTSAGDRCDVVGIAVDDRWNAIGTHFGNR